MLSPWILAVVTLAQAGGTAVEWKPFTSAKGKFTVSMPSKPTEKRRVLAVSGKTVDLVSATARKGLATYTTAYAELAGADSATAIKVAQADLLAQSRGELKEEKEIALGESPGKEFSIEIPKKVVSGGAVESARLYVVGGRLYELVAVVPTAKAESLADEVNSFFDSFKPTGVKLATNAAPTPDPKAEVAKPAASNAPTAKPEKAKPAASNAPTAKPEKAPPMPANPGGALLGGLKAMNPFAGRGSAATAKPSAKPPEAVKGVVFKAPDGSFTITTPVPLVAADVTKLPGLPANANIKGQMYQVSHDKKQYTVVVTEVPAEVFATRTVPTMLAGGRDNAVKVSASNLVRSRLLTSDGMDGMEFVITSTKIDPAQGGTGINRLFVDVRSKRLYVLTVSGSTGLDEEKVVKDFLDSFHLLAGAGTR